MSEILAVPNFPPTTTFAERHNYREVHGLPGPIDKWLTTCSRSPRINFLQNYLMLEDPKVEYVDCLVECICEELSAAGGETGPQTQQIYTLYITATASPHASTILFLRKSPRVILERFVGPNTAPNAPEWTTWENSNLEFQQPKATFAPLFVRMATWELNKSQMGLPYRMAQWARSVTVPTRSMVASLYFAPMTPRKSRQILNARSRKCRNTSPTDTSATEMSSPSSEAKRRILSHRKATVDQ